MTRSLMGGAGLSFLWLTENTLGWDVAAGSILQVVSAVAAENFRGDAGAGSGLDRDERPSGIEFIFIKSGFVFADAKPGHRAEDSADRGARNRAAERHRQNPSRDDGTEAGDKQGGGSAQNGADSSAG